MNPELPPEFADYTPEQMRAVKRELVKARARKSLFHFTHYTFPDYKPNWHHRILCEYLDAVTRREVTRLIITMPPRHGKSEHVTRRFPAHEFGVNPNTRIISCSYGADLAAQMNRDVQRIIDDERYFELFPDTRLSAANIRTVAFGNYLRNSDMFEIVGKKGFYRGTGIGGGITGMGFDVGIIDDPLKNREEAESPVTREKIWNWYTSTFYTRQQTNAAIIVTQTRWHHDDLTGHLLKQMLDDPESDQWVVLNLPAIKEGKPTRTDPREPGVALWESFLSLKDLIRRRAVLTDYEFMPLYQQSPSKVGGGMINTIILLRHKIESIPSNIVLLVRFWDLAYSEDTRADYNVGLLMGLTDTNEQIILDITRFQADWGDVPNRIVDIALTDGIGTIIAVESAFYQSSAAKDLLKRRELLRHTIRRYRPSTDKVTRALLFASRVKEGMVYILDRAWVDNFVAECDEFPLGDKDDQIDAASGATNVIAQLGVEMGEVHDIYGLRKQLGMGGVSIDPAELYAVEMARRDRRANWMRIADGEPDEVQEMYAY